MTYSWRFLPAVVSYIFLFFNIRRFQKGNKQEERKKDSYCWHYLFFFRSNTLILATVCKQTQHVRVRNVYQRNMSVFGSVQSTQISFPPFFLDLFWLLYPLGTFIQLKHACTLRQGQPDRPLHSLRSWKSINRQTLYSSECLLSDIEALKLWKDHSGSQGIIRSHQWNHCQQAEK